MHPLLRNAVIGAVGFLLSVGLVVLGLLRVEDPGQQVLAMIAGAVLGAITAAYLFVQAWRWSVRAYREGYTARSAAIALAGGLMALIAAFAVSGGAIMIFLFAGTLGG